MRISRDIRHRVELVADERKIDPAEIAAALASGQRLIQFAEQHALSIDWLVLGDLRGLQRQTRWARWDIPRTANVHPM